MFRIRPNLGQCAYRPSAVEPLEPRNLLAAEILAAVDISSLGSPLVPGDVVTLSVLVTNIGDAQALGKVNIDLHLSPTQSADDALATVVLANQSVKLAPGRSKLYKAKYVVPSTLPAGDYHLLADVDPAGAVPDDNPGNNFAASAQTVALAYKFGQVPGRAKATRLVVTDADGSKATFTLSGAGMGELSPSGGSWSLALGGTDAGSSLKLSVKGGDGRLTLAGMQGQSLKKLNASSLDVAGDIIFSGSVAAVSLGDLSGGTMAVNGLGGGLAFSARSIQNATLATADSIKSLVIKGDLAGSRVLAGAALGGDGAVGGDGLAADAFAPAWIGKLSVSGSVSDSLVFSGVHPCDGAFNDLNDIPLGGSSSFIKSITIGGTLDNASNVNTGLLPASVKIAGSKTLTAQDARFGQNALAMCDAGMTDANGEVTLSIAGAQQTFRFLDEVTLRPLAGAGVGVAVDAQSKSLGVLTLVSPSRSCPVQIIMLQGSAPLDVAPTADDGLAHSEPVATAEEEDPVCVFVGDTATKATQDVITDKMVERMWHSVDEADRSVIGSTVGVLTSAFTSLVSIAAQMLDSAADGAVSNYISSLPGATSEVLTPEQAKQRVIDARVSDLAGTMLLAGLARKLDPLMPYGVAFDLAGDYVSWSVADMAADLPGMGVRVTSIWGMDIYSFAPIPPWQRAAESGLVSVAVPSAADAENGFLELISKGQMGSGYMVPLDTGGNASIAVPLGDYIGVVHVPGWQPSRVDVSVGAGGVPLNVELQPPPPAGFVITGADETLRTSESGQSASFSVALASQPTGNVTIALSSSDTTEGKLSKTSLVFTPENWNVPQAVLVTGVNDKIRDGSQAYSIVLAPAVSTDAAYNALKPDDIAAVNADNEEYSHPVVKFTSASPRPLYHWYGTEFEITVYGEVAGPVGTNFRFPGYGYGVQQFHMDSWTGYNEATGRFWRNPGDPPSTTFSFVNMQSMGSYPVMSYVICNVYPPDSLGEFEQAKIDVWLAP